MATWNGAKYVSEQLESIVKQTHTNWHLHVFDDGSTDGTLRILQEFTANYPNRVTLYDAPPVRSAKENFFRLLRVAPDSPYYAFCDQDDYWEQEKLRVLVSVCQSLEVTGESHTPCLVYSDLLVATESLEPIGSFVGEIRALPSKVTFGSLLVENLVPGCSMLINRSLVQLFLRWEGTLDDAIMHDWWLALIAKGAGKFVFVDQRLVLYRQHNENSLGSVRRSGLKFIWSKLTRERTNPFSGALAQAELLQEIHAGDLTPESAATLKAYCSIRPKPKIGRAITCIRAGILKQTLTRRVYQLIRI